MKKAILLLVFAASACCPLQATLDNVAGGEAPGSDFAEMMRREMEKFGLCGRVTQDQDRVVVTFTLALWNMSTADVKLQLEQRGGRLFALICDQRSEVIVTCPIPPLPCPVVAGEAEGKITSMTNFEIIFRKAQPTVTVTEVTEDLLADVE